MNNVSILESEMRSKVSWCNFHEYSFKRTGDTNHLYSCTRLREEIFNIATIWMSIGDEN